MDGSFQHQRDVHPSAGDKSHLVSGFGTAPLTPRLLDAGMGVAVGRRTVFRPEDQECFGRVADRVAEGNISLVRTPALRFEAMRPAALDPAMRHPGPLHPAAPRHPLLRSDTAAEPARSMTPPTSWDCDAEQSRLRNAIATGALLASGRHLQHGDAAQSGRNMEVFTNCATAIASFAEFYLLLNGSGVGRAYDDELVNVDWSFAPTLMLHLSPTHTDYPADPEAMCRFGVELGVLSWGITAATLTPTDEARLRGFLGQELLADLSHAPAGAIIHQIADSREGWAKAVEILESMAFRRLRDHVLVLDLSIVRPAGAPIAGMQGRPASGPISLLRGLLNIRRHVIEPARDRDPESETLQPWEQALLVDHHLSVEVQVGGARRAARMATKSWRDAGVLRFIRSKSEGGLWTANHSVMVDREFWEAVARTDPADAFSLAPTDAVAAHARQVFDEVTRCAYVNGEPGLINGDQLEDHRTGAARQKPVYADGRDFRSQRYQLDHAAALMADASARAAAARFPVTTNPCGEITLHVTGGYCVIGDFAPLLACPAGLDSFVPGDAEAEVVREWDTRVEESVRLGVRFLLRANRMDALYAEEVARTNRIGIGPTGLHEWAWMRFGYDFHDLLDEHRSAPFWRMLRALSDIAKQEAVEYAAELGMARPVTVTTVKPAGTTSKLFGLTEGAHLPARRQYLRWVQFKGQRDQASGAWATGSDPLLGEYEARGYPVRELRTFPGMSIVGFPTVPLALRLGLGDRLVTAPEASPEQQYHWLRLLERHWIGAEQGNQVSYTLKVYTDRFNLDAFRSIVRTEQPQVRCCSVLPSRPDSELGYEYLPEEEVPTGRFAALVANIRDGAVREAVDWAHLQCASGVCPV